MEPIYAYFCSVKKQTDHQTVSIAMKIAYIVYRDNGPFSFADVEHDSLLRFLRKKGLNIHQEAWADEQVDWEQYQCIVMKSPWDYVEKAEAFYAWLEKMKQLNILLLNDADIVKWNCDPLTSVVPGTLSNP